MAVAVARTEREESAAGVGACRDNILNGCCAQLSSRWEV